MKNYFLIITVATGLSLAPQSYSKESVVDTKVKLSCSISGWFPDGTRVKGSGAEEISIEIQRINWNKDTPAKPPAWGSMTNIKVKSNSKDYEASLLRSNKEQVAFSFSTDAKFDGVDQTLLLVYEIRLDKLKLKRTVMTLFSNGNDVTQSNEGSCSKMALPVKPKSTPPKDGVDWNNPLLKN